MDVEPSVAPPYARITTVEDLPAALDRLGVPGARPVLVCVGGAAGMSDEDQARVERLVGERLVPVLERRGAVVVDGGTDAGVMRVLGRARRATGALFPLLGVAAVGTVRLPGAGPVPSSGTGDVRLDPHHTGVLLVPGSRWGDESVWLARVAGQVTDGEPSATLVLNGGEVAVTDVEHSLRAGRRVLVVAGTGRTADAIAAAVGAAGSPDPRTARIVSSGLVTVLHLDRPEELAAAVEVALTQSRADAEPGGRG